MMSIRNKILLLAGLAVLMLMPDPISAQVMMPGGPQFQMDRDFMHGQNRGPRWKEHGRNLDNFRMFKMLEILELDDEQNDRFIGVFSGYRTTTKKINEEIESVIRSLIDDLHNPDIAVDSIVTKTERVKKLRQEREKARDKFHADAAAILNPIQIARLTVFEERFERELLEALRGFRNPPTPSDEP